MLDDSVNSVRLNGSANGCGTLGQRGSGGSSQFTKKSVAPPAPLPGALQPGSDVSTTGAPKYTITYGLFGDVIVTISGTPLSATTSENVITFGPTDTYAYVQCDYTYDESTGIKITTDSELKTGSGSPPTSTISGGSGTQYKIVMSVTITAPVGSGPYVVVAAPAVLSSQDFNICLAGPSVSGPFPV